MVDEPMVSTRPNAANSGVRSTSQYEVEWRDGLSRLMSNLEGELQRGQAPGHSRRRTSEADDRESSSRVVRDRTTLSPNAVVRTVRGA